MVARLINAGEEVRFLPDGMDTNDNFSGYYVRNGQYGTYNSDGGFDALGDVASQINRPAEVTQNGSMYTVSAPQVYTDNTNYESQNTQLAREAAARQQQQSTLLDLIGQGKSVDLASITTAAPRAQEIIPNNPAQAQIQKYFDSTYGTTVARDLAQKYGSALGYTPEQVDQIAGQSMAERLRSGWSQGNEGINLGLTPFTSDIIGKLAQSKGVDPESQQYKQAMGIAGQADQKFQDLRSIESDSGGFFKDLGGSISSLGPILPALLTFAGVPPGVVSGLNAAIAASQGDYLGAALAALPTGIDYGLNNYAPDLSASLKSTLGNTGFEVAKGAVAGGIGGAAQGDFGLGLTSGLVSGLGKAASDGLKGFMSSGAGANDYETGTPQSVGGYYDPDAPFDADEFIQSLQPTTQPSGGLEMFAPPDDLDFLRPIKTVDLTQPEAPSYTPPVSDYVSPSRDLFSGVTFPQQGLSSDLAGNGFDAGIKSDLSYDPASFITAALPPTAQAGLGLQLPSSDNAPNLKAMGGGQGLTLGTINGPTDAITGLPSTGTLSSQGFVPDTAVPVLGNPNSFINSPSTLGTPVVPTDPNTQGLLDAIKSNTLLSTGILSLLGGALTPAQEKKPSYASSINSTPSAYFRDTSFAKPNNPVLDYSQIAPQSTPPAVVAPAAPPVSSLPSSIPDFYKKSPYGIIGYAEGGQINPTMQELSELAKGGRAQYIKGQGTGLSDSVPAVVDNTQPVRLARNEYVIPADVVSQIGDGASDAGAERLDALIEQVRQQKYGRKTQPKELKSGTLEKTLGLKK